MIPALRAFTCGDWRRRPRRCPFVLQSTEGLEHVYHAKSMGQRYVRLHAAPPAPRPVVRKQSIHTITRPTVAL